MALEPDGVEVQVAYQIKGFLTVLPEVAQSDNPGEAVSRLLVEVSQLLLAGGRLGALTDIVPSERFETDTGADPDLDDLRTALAVLLDPIDEYAEVFDPYEPRPELMICRISDDLSGVASALLHGLAHWEAGREDEALWWWQFSYISSWGSQAATTLRALQSVLAHDRLDADGKATALLTAETVGS